MQGIAEGRSSDCFACCALQDCSSNSVWCRFIWELILRNRVGRAILLTTHSMVEADLLCDDIAIMVDGQLMAQGTPAELKQQFGAGFTLTLTVSSGRYRAHEPA